MQCETTQFHTIAFTFTCTFKLTRCGCIVLLMLKYIPIYLHLFICKQIVELFNATLQSVCICERHKYYLVIQRMQWWTYINAFPTIFWLMGLHFEVKNLFLNSHSLFRSHDSIYHANKRLLLLPRAFALAFDLLFKILVENITLKYKYCINISSTRYRAIIVSIFSSCYYLIFVI